MWIEGKSRKEIDGNLSQTFGILEKGYTEIKVKLSVISIEFLSNLELNVAWQLWNFVYIVKYQRLIKIYH